MTGHDERKLVLARFLRSQIALANRPPVGRVELNNEEAELCAVALEGECHSDECHSDERDRIVQLEIELGELRSGCLAAADRIERGVGVDGVHRTLRALGESGG